MLKHRNVFVAATLAILLGATSAHATPIINGGFSISGNFLGVNALTGASTSLGSATGLDFLMLSGSSPTPGTPGNFLVNSGSGDFGALAGQIGAIRDFAFAGPGSASFPNPNIAGPLLAFQNVGGLTFTLNSLAAPILQTNTFLILSGQGVFNMAGFAATSGTFNFTGNSAGGTFSFSASNAATGAVSVPEPATLSLLGFGLLGLGFLGRRKHRA